MNKLKTCTNKGAFLKTFGKSIVICGEIAAIGIPTLQKSTKTDPSTVGSDRFPSLCLFI